MPVLTPRHTCRRRRRTCGVRLASPSPSPSLLLVLHGASSSLVSKVWCMVPSVVQRVLPYNALKNPQSYSSSSRLHRGNGARLARWILLAKLDCSTKTHTTSNSLFLYADICSLYRMAPHTTRSVEKALPFSVLASTPHGSRPRILLVSFSARCEGKKKSYHTNMFFF